MLSAFELVAGEGMQLVEVVGAEVCNRVTLESCLQILDGPEFRTARQERVHRSVPKPCSVWLCSNACRSCANCFSWSRAGPPRPGVARSASIPPSSSNPFHLYTVCRATPTARATSAGPLPAKSMRPARKRFFVAASTGFFAMASVSNQSIRDVARQYRIVCHVLWKPK